MPTSRFAKYTWFVLAYNFLVILWGAYVRATGSGAGCGSHWPLCNGDVIPRAPQIETIVEFTHRLTSGFSLILVVILFLWAWRATPKGNLIRKGAAACLGLILLEALFGAGLVLFKWVAKDESLGRLISMPAHLVVTFLLLAAISLTGWWASGGKALRIQGRGWPAWGWILTLVGVTIIGMSGAITALGDTLFPAGSLAAGLQQDISSQAHFLERVRVAHPVISALVGFYLLGYAYFYGITRPQRLAQTLSKALIVLVVAQWLAGIVNIALLAPVWIQLVHLLLADLVWVTLVLLGAAIFSE
jgi:heme a synthase